MSVATVLRKLCVVTLGTQRSLRTSIQRARHQAGRLLRVILRNDERPATAHHIAAATPRELLPARVANAVECRAAAMRHRASNYQQRLTALARASASRDARGLEIGSARSRDYGLDL